MVPGTAEIGAVEAQLYILLVARADLPARRPTAVRPTQGTRFSRKQTAVTSGHPVIAVISTQLFQI